MNRISKISAILLLVAVTYGLALFFIFKDSDKCDTHIIFTDGTYLDCANITSSESGMSYIRKCDGKKISVPTIRIKEVQEK